MLYFVEGFCLLLKAFVSCCEGYFDTARIQFVIYGCLDGIV